MAISGEITKRIYDTHGLSISVDLMTTRLKHILVMHCIVTKSFAARVTLLQLDSERKLLTEH